MRTTKQIERLADDDGRKDNERDDGLKHEGKVVLLRDRRVCWSRETVQS